MDSSEAIIYKRARQLAQEAGFDWDSMFAEDRQEFIDVARNEDITEDHPVHGPHGPGCTCPPEGNPRLNKEKILHRSDEPNNRLTRLTDIAIHAIREADEYRPDDKIAVMMSNDVIHADFDRTDSGCGFWNFDNPPDLITTIMVHVQAIADSYGIGMAVAELHKAEDVTEKPQMLMDAIIGAVVRQMMLDEERGQGNGG